MSSFSVIVTKVLLKCKCDFICMCKENCLHITQMAGLGLSSAIPIEPINKAALVNKEISIIGFIKLHSFR